jgi:hypothetical protein
VVTPQARVEDAGALAEVVTGEVVLGVLADAPATGVRSPPALAEEVGLLTREPCPGVGLGVEKLGVPLTIGAEVPGAVAAAREPVDRPECSLGHAATLAGGSVGVCRDHRWLGTRPLSTRASSVARSKRTYLPILT